MKITTLNLQGFDDWETRTNTIASYLKRKKSDIVFFQEVVFLPEVNAHNQVQLLNNDLCYPYQQTVISRLQVGLEYPVYREGLGCLSRYPIVSSDTIVLQQASGDEHQRIVQLIDVSVNGEIIKFANVHFSITDFTDFATAHLEETLTTLKARGEKRIIVGDFNLNHLEESIDIWGEDYSASTDFTYVSYPSMEKRNDYFLIPKQFSFEAFEVSDEENMSDHNALTATVAVPAFQQQAKLASLVAAYKE